MIKKKKIISYLIISAIIVSGFFIYEFKINKNSEVSGAGWGQPVTIPKDRAHAVGDAIDPFESPESFIFNPANSNNLESYYNGRRFYESKYLGKYNMYSWKNPDIGNTPLTQLNYDFLYENRINQFYGNYLVDAGYSANLKSGSVKPNTQTYLGYNSGNMFLQTGPYKGSHFEWRYLGYTPEGTVINNPYFPADAPPPWAVANWNLSWVTYAWRDYTSMVKESPYVSADPVILKSWYENYLFKQFPSFKTVAMNKGGLSSANAWKYWQTRLMWQTDPSKGTGILIGVHTTFGGARYRTITVESPSKPNLRITNMTVSEKVTGRVIAIGSRSETSQDSKFTVTYPGGKYVSKGKQYEIKTTVKNMTSGASHTTNKSPTLIDMRFSYDAKIYVAGGSYDEQYDKSVTSSNYPLKIPYEKKANFSLLDPSVTSPYLKGGYTVPTSVSKEIEFVSHIPKEYYYSGDNTDLEDDFGPIPFLIAPEDMAIDNTIELIDKNGDSTQDVVAGDKYTIKYFVKKVAGSNPVGDASDIENPFATVNSTISNGSNTISKNGVATETLLPNGIVEVQVKDYIASTSYIKACGTIDAKHKALGQNSVTTNDGPVCKIWQSELNLSVNDFKVTPKSIIKPYGQSAGSETLTFNFDLSNKNPNKQTITTKILIKQGSRIILNQNISIPWGTKYHQTLYSSVSLFYGSMPFSVEVNPAPRNVVETKIDGTNPYADNLSTDSIEVKQNPRADAECLVVNTDNRWTQQYEIYQWRGYLEYYDCSYWRCTEREDYERADGTTGRRCIDWEYIDKTCSRCITTDEWTENPVVSHYETFAITHVYFKSKLTTDNQGGWIDIVNGSPGKIKAGYGFELKIVTRYDTNRYRSAPKPWGSTCNGKSVDPGYSVINSPNIVTLTMPYSDRGGVPVKYNLYGSESGSWDDMTANYELPYRDVFGIKSAPQIFINEGARDGVYNIRMDTPAWFEGTPDKPYVRNLCDRKYVKIQVIGGANDDIKTHLVQ